MLEGMPAQQFETETFRYASLPKDARDLLLEMRLDPDGVNEMIDLLHDRGMLFGPEQILDGPFTPKPLLHGKPYQTRFSDGSIRVYYSALDHETAEAEMYYWTIKPLLEGPPRVWTVLFQCAACRFSGQVKDLRPKIAEWPFLTADKGYDVCNQVAAEAKAAGLDGLLSQSARRQEGTTLPVFKRECLSDARLEGERIFMYDPSRIPPLLAHP